MPSVVADEGNADAVRNFTHSGWASRVEPPLTGTLCGRAMTKTQRI